MSVVTEVTQRDFEEKVLQSDQPVLVDFWAPWCGPCRMLAPVLEKAAQKFAGQVKFVKVNTDENRDLADRYNVKGIPHLLLFKGGHVVERMAGNVPEDTLASMLRPRESDQALAEVTQTDFEQKVLQNSEPVLVYAGAPQSGLYRTLIPVVERVAQKLAGQVQFLKLNTDENPNIGERYHISSGRPCFMLFKGGYVVDRIEGNISEDTIVSMLSSKENDKAIAEVTEADFEQKVLQGGGLILVDFWAPWMGSYRRAARIVEEKFAGRVKFFKLNTDEHPNIREHYRIPPGLPCLMLFKGGQAEGQILGYVSVGGPYIHEVVSMSSSWEQEVASMLSSWEQENDSREIRAIAEVTQTDFEQQVLQSHEPVLVHFGAPWMGSYRRAARVVEEKFAGRVEFFKLNTDENPNIHERYQISPRAPWLVLFQDGEIVDRIYGYSNGGGVSEGETASMLSSWEQKNDSRETRVVAEVTQTDFEQKVLQSREPVLVHFGTLWMGSYHWPAEVLEEKFAGQMKFFKLDINKIPNLKERYALQAFPCLVLFKNGEVIDRIYGINRASKGRIASKLADALT